MARYSLPLAAVVLIGIVWSGLSAQSYDAPGIIQVGAVAQANGDMNLRDSAPAGRFLWYEKGDLVGVLKKGETVKITAIRQYPSFYGYQKWVKIQRQDPNVDPPTGWVYYGGEEYLFALDRLKK